MVNSISIDPETGLFDVSSSTSSGSSDSSTSSGSSDSSVSSGSDSGVLPFIVNSDGSLTLIDGGDQSDVDTDTTSDQGVDLSDQVETAEGVEESEDMVIYDNSVSLASVASGSQSYTVQSWQLALAQNRDFGDHYLLWAVREYYSNYSYYWHYYAVIGKDIELSDDTYTYTDCDVYELYSYNDSTTYLFQESSGTVSGSSYVVYSDLYFDYVGTKPTLSSAYLIVVFLLVLSMLFIISLRRK